MVRFNLFLGILALFILSITVWTKKNWVLEEWNSLLTSNDRNFDFETLDLETKSRLKESYSPLPKLEIRNLSGISYNKYSKIQFKPELSIWKNIGLPFQLQFFHPGHLYNHLISIYELEDGSPKEFDYDHNYFDFGKIRLAEDFHESINDLKYTGFRILFPINSNNLEEFAVFQGSNYFRVLSKGQVYGLSGRGIAINTGIADKEEFPEFDKFYITKPDEFDNSITIYATLNGKSVVGTYRFIFYPGITTQVQVKARIYLRRPVKRLGIAPLTSMFLYSETHDPIGNNIYPEIHDSDGLLIEDKSGDWIYRPLINPKKSKVIGIDANNFKGFGLVQRDRKFKSYQDNKMKYHLRPSAWIKPSKNWGEGTIHLMQNATLLDSDDNIGVFFEPKLKLEVGKLYNFEYTVFFPDLSPPNHRLTKVSSVFKGSDPLYPKSEVMTMYFTGKQFGREEVEKKIQPVIKTNREDLKIISKLEKIEELNQVRLILIYDKVEMNHDNPLEWKIYLKDGEEKISETWIYYDGL